ncbi:hypothetical protein CALVIDRAFT_599535 [Calocera viscosa TUFC12733]|uniref:Defect at low temperature protein 1 n=1 Tax=Calocera viscosa (strain TUFC12733) TaxID=1330018 RepID=A0A167KWN8_CALVF|nr:hypothetical protein CALVIDRAFT_599535 [Calocera viscosa TUFC12733]
MALIYHVSFFLFVVLTGIAVVGSAAGLIAQAWLSGGQRRWDVVIVVGSYIALAVMSTLIIINRLWSIRVALSQIPKAYIPVKEEDAPKDVYKLVEAEYTRASLIAYIARPRNKVAPGWGTPGGDLENIFLPRALLDTLSTVDAAVRNLLPSLLPIRPQVTVTQHLAPLTEILHGEKFHEQIRLYDALVQRARYGYVNEDLLLTELEYMEGVRLSAELAKVFNALSVLRQPHPNVNARDFASPSPVLDLLSQTSLSDPLGSGLSS